MLPIFCPLSSVLQIIVNPFVIFLLDILVSCRLRITASSYTFDIIDLFLGQHDIPQNWGENK